MMTRIGKISAALVLSLAVLGSMSGAHAFDNGIGEALQNSDINPPLRLSDDPRIQERMILLSKRCMKARHSQRYHQKMNYLCEQKDPGMYYSTRTCRCETLI